MKGLMFSDAFGYILAEDIRARSPLPPFPASVMDGYAVIGMCMKLELIFALFSIRRPIVVTFCNP